MLHFTLFSLALLVLFGFAGSVSLSPIVQLSSKDGAGLRHALFSGHPHLIVCKEEKQEGLISTLRSELGSEVATSTITVAHLDCTEKISKRLGLDKRNKLPVLVLAASGNKPHQLGANTFTSQVKGGKAGEVSLDMPKLARYVAKRAAAKVGRLESNAELKSDCLGRKHQVCAVVLHHGALSAAHKTLLKKLAPRHRGVRLYAIDVTKYELLLPVPLPVLSEGSDPALVIFKQQQTSTSDSNSGSASGEEEGTARTLSAFERQIEVSSAGDRVALLVRDGASEAAKSAAFEQGIVRSAKAFAKVDPAKAVFRTMTQERGGRVVFLDYIAATPLLLSQGLFGDSSRASGAQLVELEHDSIERQKKRAKGLFAVESATMPAQQFKSKPLDAFLRKATESGSSATSWAALPSLPTLKAIKRAQPSAAAAAAKKKKRKKETKAPAAAKKKKSRRERTNDRRQKKRRGSPLADDDDDIVAELLRAERERARREEMEREAEEFLPQAVVDDDDDDGSWEVGVDEDELLDLDEDDGSWGVDEDVETTDDEEVIDLDDDEHDEL